MGPTTWRHRLRYAFDEFMSRGTIALILGLFAISFLIILAIALVVSLTGFAQDQGLDFPTLLWRGLMRTLDPGTMGGDEGSAGFLMAMLAVTLGGIFVISTLIGIINAGIEGKLADLRKGRSRVIEHDHTVILGWSQQVHTIVAEIIEANSNQGRRSIVVLADRDKVEMEDELRERVGSFGRTKVVCRTGSPMDVGDVALASLVSARSIVVLAPETDEPDADVIKTILAVTNHPDRRPEPYHIVAEIRDRSNLDVARMVGGDEVELILSEEVIARITAQTCRQSGLSVVYSELLDFSGDEIYLTDVGDLAGTTFGDALAAFGDASVIGVQVAGGDPKLNPPTDTLLAAGDRLVVIASDDDRISRSGEPVPVDEARLRTPTTRPISPERTLVLGWNHRAPGIIAELDAYVAEGSEVLVVASVPAASLELDRLDGRVVNQRLAFRSGDVSVRSVLESLAVETFDHIIVLCYSDDLDAQRADARTLITLLHLRDISARLDRDFAIVSEMIDLRDRALAEVARADDFIVSDRLISLMIAQVAETKHLNAVFTDLLDPAGSEIYLKPAGDYVALEEPVPFAAVLEAARRRGEVAFGYRSAAGSEDAASGYGVRINPPKAESRAFAQADRVIVLADS